MILDVDVPVTVKELSSSVSTDLSNSVRYKKVSSFCWDIAVMVAVAPLLNMIFCPVSKPVEDSIFSL